MSCSFKFNPFSVATLFGEKCSTTNQHAETLQKMRGGDVVESIHRDAGSIRVIRVSVLGFPALHPERQKHVLNPRNVGLHKSQRNSKGMEMWPEFKEIHGKSDTDVCFGLSWQLVREVETPL